MKKIYLLLMLLTAVSGSYAQINFEAGYFLNNNGTKTECLIKNVAWKNNPEEFEYKLNESSVIQKGIISSVSEFSVGAHKFKRFAVKIDLSRKELSNLSKVREPEWNEKTLFLSVMVEGLATLYKYEQTNLTRYFISTEKDPDAQQLIYKPFQTYDKVNMLSGPQIDYNNEFRGQLYEIMRDRLKDKKRFKSLDYSRDDLTKLFAEYNGSQNEANNFGTSQNKTIVNLKITPGVNFSSFSMERSLGQVRKIEFDNKALFRIGVEIEVLLPFNNNKWSVFVDPNYSNYKSEGLEQTNKWTADISYFEIPIGVRHYMYLNKNSKIFIDAMYSIALSTGKSSVKTYYNNLSIADPDFEISNISYLSIGSGFSYKRYSVEARYNVNRNILNYVFNKGNYSNFSIIAGYKIF